MQVSDASEKVSKEMKRFRRALPKLLRKYKDRWVVFINGQVHSDHGNEESAYIEGLRSFGVDGGFVVTQVVNVEPVPISAGVVFGIQ